MSERLAYRGQRLGPGPARRDCRRDELLYNEDAVVDCVRMSANNRSRPLVHLKFAVNAFETRSLAILL